MENLYEHAENYLVMHNIATVLMQGKKKPVIKWKRFQTNPQTIEDLEKMHARSGTQLGAILGPPSGGLYCRDFDDLSVYEEWASAHELLADTLPTTITSRGRHVLAWSKDLVRTRQVRGGELRGMWFDQDRGWKGALSVLPPSRHQSGHVYKWAVPLPKEPIYITPEKAGFIGTERTEYTESTEYTEVNRVNESGLAQTPEKAPSFAPMSLTDLIKACLPTARKQNHKMLFKLARGVKALEKARQSPFTDAEHVEAFNGWWKLAHKYRDPSITVDEYCEEYRIAHDGALFPLGESGVKTAWENAIRQEPPEIAKDFDPTLRPAISLFRELQRINKDKPFFLSCRTLQGLLKHENHKRSAMLLRAFCRRGVIKEVVKGGPHTNRATRYQYLHPL